MRGEGTILPTPGLPHHTLSRGQRAGQGWGWPDGAGQGWDWPDGADTVPLDNWPVS